MSNPNPNEQNPPVHMASIETFKVALRNVEKRIATRHPKRQLQAGAPTPLCKSCAAVSERLDEVFRGAGARARPEEPALGGARDAVGNLHLGTLDEVLGRDIDECVGAVAVGTVVGDGVLSVWWPESMVDEVNDEPVRIPMMAVDHEGVFPGARPWIPLPREKVGSERDLSMFGKCFESCVQNHVKCREGAAGVGGGFGPGRLIDIEEMRIVRVEIDESPVYFILSYVWGRPPFLLLEKSNEGRFSTPGFLSSQKMPQTISDAIEVTRRFGVRYLWVDALCIVQDDLESKMHEIDRMHMIYAQAQMTIVAATGDGANAGLLNIDPVFLNDTSHLISGKRFTTDAMEMREVVEFSTWFTRGWTFQELVFSKRTLYFTPERTYYACEEGSWSEDFPFDGNGVPGEDANVFFDESLKTGFDLRERLDSFENYSSMVSRMSTRQFTQESDCLNACKGLYTGVLLKGLGGSVCGLPALCFEFALAWQPEGNLSRRQISQNSKHPQFPSWSWAAWNGPIDYPFLSGPEKCGVICDVRWAVFEAYAAPTAGKSHEYRFKQVIPTIKVHTSPEQSYQSMSSWHSYSYAPDPRQTETESKISALIDTDAEMASGKIMSNNFIGPSILIFQTRSITCQIKAASRPPLSRHKDLSFCSISNNNVTIGELKVDSATLNSFLVCDQHDAHFESDPITIELISLFEIDFANAAVQDLLWINANSSRGTFSKAFMALVQERDDRSMRAVMWITWEEGVASRRAVGYVTVEGFEDAGPVGRHVILV
ncbi:hypothetical protein EYC80_006685 [Monilinia laxa]|uniref:Heterokaryon incompatibility domain-containing protein n=1 Tax=Monilinia laxa TaxID=61186 RepID=A0A5N6JYY1_MONLA|nr:hypothetical protein EYC80_006685 [Monilinia laxa]